MVDVPAGSCKALGCVLWRSTMNILGIETSTDACSVALLCDGVITSDHCVVPRGHHQILLPMIESLLAAAGVSPRRLDGVALSAGPGSFTGLRIGASVVQALALAADCPVCGVSSLCVLAAGVLAGEPASCVIAVQPARPGEVYAGVYKLGERFPEPMIDDRIVRSNPETHEFGTLHGRYSGVVAGVGAAAVIARLPPGSWREYSDPYPHAAALLPIVAAEFAAGRGTDPAQLELKYLNDASAWRKV